MCIRDRSTNQAYYFVIESQIDGEDLVELEDWIGAFKDGICVGSWPWVGPYTTIPVMGYDGDELTDIMETQAGLNPLSADSDGDGILDHNDIDNESYESENNIYEIDSIYGNSNASFNLKVFELTYYLNSLDPAKNFETNRTYYSDDDYFERGFYDAILHDKTINLNLEELRFNYKEYMSTVIGSNCREVTEDLIKFDELWWKYSLIGPNRDQISFDTARQLTSMKMNILEHGWWVEKNGCRFPGTMGVLFGSTGKVGRKKLHPQAGHDKQYLERDKNLEELKKLTG